MAHTYIKQVISRYKVKGVWITLIEDGEGNTATGVGKFKAGDSIITFFDDRYNKVKFKVATPPNTIYSVN